MCQSSGKGFGSKLTWFALDASLGLVGFDLDLKCDRSIGGVIHTPIEGVALHVDELTLMAHLWIDLHSHQGRVEVAPCLWALALEREKGDGETPVRWKIPSIKDYWKKVQVEKTNMRSSANQRNWSRIIGRCRWKICGWEELEQGTSPGWEWLGKSGKSGSGRRHLSLSFTDGGLLSFTTFYLILPHFVRGLSHFYLIYNSLSHFTTGLSYFTVGLYHLPEVYLILPEVYLIYQKFISAKITKPMVLNSFA